MVVYFTNKQGSVALDSQANKTLDNERIHKHMSLFLHEIIIIAYKTKAGQV